MRSRLYALLLVSSCGVLATPAPTSPAWGHEPVETLTATRDRLVLNGLWRFEPADAGSPTPTGDWGWIRVPGAWHTGRLFVGMPGLESRGTGPAWHREPAQVEVAWLEREVDIPARWAGRDIILNLQRVSTDAEVFVGDQPAGRIAWPRGEVVLTGLVTPGSRATLRLKVRASTTGFTESVADFNDVRRQPAELLSRGITDDVWLETRPRGPHLAGMFIRPSVRTGTLGLDLDLAGPWPAGDCELAVTAREWPHGRIARTWTQTVRDPAGAIVGLEFPWPDARRWDFREPHLYTLEVRLAGPGAADTLAERFGFREVWIEGRTVMLNGTPFRFRPISMPNDFSVAPAAPEIVRGLIHGYLRDHYNLLELWPHTESRGTLQWRKTWAEHADELGFPLMSGTFDVGPFIGRWDESGVRAGWEERWLAEWKRLRNHPSVLVLTSNANRFAHGDDQSPVRIGNSVTGPSPTEEFQRRARVGAEAIAVMNRHDPTRPSTHHHTGGIGQIYTQNMYLCLLPLQEQEEWLSEWARSGDQPFMCVEFDVPLFLGGQRGRTGFRITLNSEPLFTEWAALHFGEQAYGWESPGYRAAIARDHVEGETYRDVWSGWSLERTWQAVQQRYISRIWPAWRAWGITGGMVPWHHVGPYVNWTLGERVPLAPSPPGRRGLSYSSLPGPLLRGMSGRWEEVRPTVDALREGNRPTLAFLGGPGARDFTDKSHHFFAGESIERSAVLINDLRRPAPYTLTWHAELDGREVARGGSEGTLAPGENAFLPVRFDAPAVTHRTAGRVTLLATVGGEPHRNELGFHAFPRRAPPVAPPAVGLLIWDPAGATSELLRSAGYAPAAWDGQPPAARTGRPSVLLLGRNAFDRADLPLPGSVADFVAGGGRVVLFGQSPEAFRRRGLGVARPVSREQFIAQSRHPLVAGLDDEAFRDWRGAGSLRPPTENIHTGPVVGYVPKFGWRWGNRGSVTSAAIELPHHTGLTPVLRGEWDLAYSPLAELAYGHGLFLLCTLDLEQRGADEPLAAEMLDRVLAYAATARPEPRRPAVYLGGDSGASVLTASGLVFTRADTLPGPDALAVVGADAAPADASLDRFLRAGGRVFFLPRGPGSLPLGLHAVAGAHGANPRVPDWPEARGLGRSDLRTRTDVPAALIGGDILARVARGPGVAIFFQADPESFDPVRQPYLRYSAWRLARARTQLLSNLGATFRGDARLLDLASAPQADDYRTAVTTGGNSDPVPPPDPHEPAGHYVRGFRAAPFHLGDDPYRYYRW